MSFQIFYQPLTRIINIYAGGSSVSWTNIQGYSRLKFVVIGGGGGGGSNNGSYTGGGGGSGAVIIGEIPLLKGDTININVGYGGAPGANGESTTLEVAGITFTAGGGSAGQNATSTANGSPGAGGTATITVSSSITRNILLLKLINGNSGNGSTGGSTPIDLSALQQLNLALDNATVYGIDIGNINTFNRFSFFLLLHVGDLDEIFRYKF